MLPLRSVDVRDAIFMFVGPGVVELRALELGQNITTSIKWTLEFVARTTSTFLY